MASVRPSRPARSWSRPFAAGMIALAALAVTGCSPITTAKPYAPSDGIRVEIGSSFSAANLLVITAAKGEPGVLVGGLTNRSEGPISVTLSPEGVADTTVRIPAKSTVLLGGDNDDPIALDAVAVAPGSVLPLTISTRDGGSEDVSIPVLDGTLPEYADLVPSAG